MWSRRHDGKSAYWHNPARWEMCRSAERTLNTLGSSVFEQAACTGLFSHLMVQWTRCNWRLTCLFNSIFHCHFQFESISIIKRIIYWLLLLFFKCFYTVTEGHLERLNVVKSILEEFCTEHSYRVIWLVIWYTLGVFALVSVSDQYRQ